MGDFGIARILDSSTAGAHTTIGTPHYLSPEMVNNEAYGTKSDLWSLGVRTPSMKTYYIWIHNMNTEICL